jgi:hypothetical protein
MDTDSEAEMLRWVAILFPLRKAVRIFKFRRPVGFCVGFVEKSNPTYGLGLPDF